MNTMQLHVWYVHKCHGSYPDIFVAFCDGALVFVLVDEHTGGEGGSHGARPRGWQGRLRGS